MCINLHILPLLLQSASLRDVYLHYLYFIDVKKWAHGTYGFYSSFWGWKCEPWISKLCIGMEMDKEDPPLASFHLYAVKKERCTYTIFVYGIFFKGNISAFSLYRFLASVSEHLFIYFRVLNILWLNKCYIQRTSFILSCKYHWTSLKISKDVIRTSLPTGRLRFIYLDTGGTENKVLKERFSLLSHMIKFVSCKNHYIILCRKVWEKIDKINFFDKLSW